MISQCHMDFRELFKSILVSGLLLFSSCAHYQCDPAYDGPSKRNAEMLEYYSYPKRVIEAKVEKIELRKKYTVERIEFPSTLNVFGTENIRFDYYMQKNTGKFPTLLVLPITSGIDFPVKSFAHHFASNGFNCAVVHNRKFNLKDIESAEEVENYFRQTVLDNRQVLDYIVERKEVDENRLGCIGFSLGGIKASLISGVDKRLKCCILCLAGGSIADIALLSKEQDIRDYIRELMKRGISSEAILIELSEKVETDPLELAKYIDARNVLMYIARFDQVVPRKCGDRLWEAIGKPEMIYLFSGHYSSFVYLPYAESESLSFFTKKFELK
ncbi:MAG: alpha/beta hydrolase [Candidatus Hodarchaeota archaeon]